MKEKFFAGVMLLFFFSTTYGMRNSRKNNVRFSERLVAYYFGNENLEFEKLMKEQRATALLFIQTHPETSSQRLRDSKNNNILHLIFSSYDKLPFFSINEAFNRSLPHLTKDMLKEENASQKTPLNLIGELPESSENYFMSLLRDKKLIKN